MKFQRIAQTALVALLATACTGGDSEPEQSASETTVVEQATTTLAARSSGGDGFDTVAPATTATPTSAPQSLAFASSRDIGRLFVVGSDAILRESAAGDPGRSVLGGTLVQATSARNRDGDLWVRLRSPQGELEDLGWISADSLNPTTQSIIVDEPQFSGELRVASSRGVQIVATPGGQDVVGELAGTEVAMHGGSQAIAPSGDLYLDVLSRETRTRIGWVPRSTFVGLSRNLIRTSEHQPVRNRPDSTVTYGTPLAPVAVGLEACNATQLVVSNPSNSTGMAFIVGTDTPVGRTRGSVEQWTAPGGTRVFAEPGETVVFTLRRDGASSWFFAGLDADLRAQAQRGADGSLIDTGSPVQATNVQQIDLSSGACGDRDRRGSFWSAPVEENPVETPGSGSGFEQVPEEEQAPTAPDESEVEDEALEDEVEETTTTTLDVSTTAAPTTTATTTTTAAPTTTTTTTSAPADGT